MFRRTPFQTSLIAAVIAIAAACSSSRREVAGASASAALPAIAVTASASAAPPKPSPRAADPRWIRAMGDDPLERARLAEAEGAAGLLDALDDGGAIGEVALAALPFAEDAEIALGRLSEIALTDPARRGAALEAILAIAGQPRRPRELLDPEGARRAGEAVLTLAKRDDLPREQRAQAISAARALAEKGYVDAGRIPTDLDPR